MGLRVLALGEGFVGHGRTLNDIFFWKLGEGRVDFWRNKWVSWEPLGDICKLGFYPQFVVADFFQDSTWNVDMLKEWLPSQVVEAVLEVIP